MQASSGRTLLSWKLNATVWVVAVLVAIVLLVTPAGVAEAHEADDNHGFRLSPSAEIASNGDLDVRLRITETGHPESVSEDTFAWNLFWFRYEYIEGGAFDCSKDHFVDPWSLEDWLSDNGYEASVYETQKDIFYKARISIIFEHDEGGYEAGISRSYNDNEITDYEDTDGKLAFCFMVEHDDGTHLALNNIVLNFSDLTTSSTGVGLGEIEGVRSNALEDDSAQQADDDSSQQSGNSNGGSGTSNTGSNNGGQTGGTQQTSVQATVQSATSTATGGTGAVDPDIPDTGIFDDSANSLPLYITLVVGVAALAAFFKVRTSMRKRSGKK